MKELTLIEAEKIMEENGGGLYLRNTPIKRLPEGLSVSGNLDLSGTEITELPDNLTVGGWLALIGTPITKLPKRLTVGDDIDLSFSSITKLPEGLTVNGNLDLSHSEIAELPNELSVSGSLSLNGTKITKLPDALTVGGSLISGTKIKELPDNLIVGDDLDLSYSSITELPNVLSVSGNLNLSDTEITKLPERFTVGGNLDLRNSKIKEVPNDLSVGGTLDLSDTPVTKLPEKLTVGGDFYLDENIKLNETQKIGGMIYGRKLISNENNKLSEGECKEGKYLFTDGILTFITGKKKVKGYTYYKGVFKNKNVLYDGKNYAHCKNFKQGVQDLLFKAAKDRGAEQYNNLTLDDVVSTSDLITMYRVITGACLQGTEIFVESLGNKLKNEYTIKEAIELTNGQYGSNVFKNFFKK